LQGYAKKNTKLEYLYIRGQKPVVDSGQLLTKIHVVYTAFLKLLTLDGKG
jgi:hypothetical protein